MKELPKRFKIMSMMKIDDEDKDKDAVPIRDSIGRNQKTPIINESGLYSLILSSKLPTAKKFKRWVTAEILPSIRKTGSYQKPTGPVLIVEDILRSSMFLFGKWIYD